MKVKHLFESVILTEALGNLAQLKVGKMIDIFRQRYNVSKKRGTDVGAIENKFSAYGVGSESEIIDCGVMKKGILDLRTAYKKQGDNNTQAFAIYANDKAVVFGAFSQDDLAGSARHGMLAFDLTPFKAAIDKQNVEKYEKESSWIKSEYKTADEYAEKRGRKLVTQERKAKGYYNKTEQDYAGTLYTTAMLKSLLEEIVEYAKEAGQTLTMKLVTLDRKAVDKRQKRYSLRMMQDVGDDLETRLKKYKLAKNPTANDIKEFFELVKKAAKLIRFGKYTYSSVPKSDDKMNGLEVLQGKSFTISYEAKDPGVYGKRVKVEYAMDLETGTVKPFMMSWPGERTYEETEEVIDNDMFLKHTFKSKTKLSADTVIKGLLTKYKAAGDYHLESIQTLIKAAKGAGFDGPELQAIEKSLIAAMKAKNTKDDDED